MLQFLLRYKKVAILFLIILFSFLWMSLQSRTLKNQPILNHIANFIALPIERGIVSISGGIIHLWDRYIYAVKTFSENQRFKEEIEKLKGEMAQHMEILEENKRLRQLLMLKESETRYVTAARVIGRDPTNWFRIVTVNKGRDDGVHKDMVVVTPSGVVGKIFQPGPHYSKVLLITDIQSTISVRIQHTRDEGIVEGKGTDRCHLKYIPHSVDLKINDAVITSGLDNIYPAGLFVGYISKINKKGGSGLFQEIEIIPGVRLNRIEEVAIIDNRKEQRR
ncbi:MAG: rod shape-determining protein MreC [Nitrospirota bacterium]